MLPDWLNHYLSPYQATLRYDRTGAEQAALELSSELVDGLRQLAFILLRPDCLAQGQAAPLLAFLENESRIKVHKLRILNLRPYQFDALYQLKAHLFAENVWLHHRIFASGPAAVVLASGDQGDHASLCHRLNALKGSSVAADVYQGGSLRALFGRASSFHAVLHISEDPGALLVEAPIFFTWAELRESLSQIRLENRLPAAVSGLPHIYRDALLDNEPAPGRSVFQSLLAVKRKLLASLLLQSGSPNEAGLRQLWEFTSSAILQLDGMPYNPQKEAFVAFARAEKVLLEDLIAGYEQGLPAELARAIGAEVENYHVAESWPSIISTLAPLQLLYASWFLSGNETYSYDDGQRLFQLLAENNVPLTQWQETVLQSALFSDANPSAHWQGHPLYPKI